MKIDPKNLQIHNQIYSSKGNLGMSKLDDASASFIKVFASDLLNSKNSEEALKLLDDHVASGQIEQKNGVLYKSGVYHIQNLFRFDGVPYKNTLSQLNKLNTSIVPELVKTVEKDDDIFIITCIKGTTSGDLIPFSEMRGKIPKENLIEAYRELQKITKAGIVDNSVLRSASAWFVTPDDNKIVIPEWGQVRPLQPNEGKEVMEQYYSILFNK